MDSIPLWILFIVLVMSGGYFSGAESAFTAMNKIKIKSKAEEGNARAKNTMYIANNFERALSTLLIGNNVARTAAASVATVIAGRLFRDIPNYTLWTTVFTTLIFFFFSEMIPKSFANDRSDSTALALSGSLRALMKVLRPFSAFFTWISCFFTRLFTGQQTPSITEDELIDMIDTAEEEGVMNEEKSEMMRSAIDFSNKTAEDVMTMRDDIEAIEVTTPLAEVLDIVRQSRHSRIPVYEGDLDHVIGILHVRHFLRAYFRSANLSLREQIRTPYFTEPTARIDDLLDYMSHSKTYLALVHNEDGHVEGLVTIEDFLEELVGEIWDEDDVVDENFVKLGGNRFAVSAASSFGDVLEKIGLEDSSGANDRSVGAWALEHFGRLPEEEESFTQPMGTMYLAATVDEVDNNRITRLILKLDEENPAEPDASANDEEEA